MATRRPHWEFMVCTALALAGGCHPQFTRVPDLIPRTRTQDKAEWNYSDPLPDHNAGPSTDHRPAGFNIQRTMPRSAVEKDSMTFQFRTPWQGSRPQAKLNPKTANVVEP